MKSKDNFFYSRYKTYRDRINHLIRINKKKHYNDFFKNNAENVKKIWQEINKLVHRNEAKQDILGIRIGNKIMTDPIEIGNKFNKYFTSIAKQLSEGIKSDNNYKDYMDPSYRDCFFMTPTDTAV